jgi:hypothetical protein
MMGLHVKQIGLYKISFVFAITLFTALGAKAQIPFGNEWINMNATYYQLPVMAEGVHRITYNTLLNAGFPVGTDPRSFKMYARGVEIPIYVQGEQDGVFATDEFIEFVGEPNTADFDSLLYSVTNGQPNLKYSMFSDSVHYFLTYGSGITGNKRFSIETDQNTGAYPSAPYYMAQITQGFQDTYHTGPYYTNNTQDPFYLAGEGYTRIYTGANTYTQPWTTFMAFLQPTIYTGGPDAKLKVRIAGANDPVSSSGNYDHRYMLSFGNASLDTSTTAFDLSRILLTSSAAALQASGNAFVIQFLATYASNTRNGLGYIEAEIPQIYALGNRTRHKMLIPDNTSGIKYTLNITGFNASNTAVRIYDITNNRRITMQGGGTNWNGVIPNGNGMKTCHIVSDASVINVSSIRPIQFKDSPIGRFKDFRSSYKDYNYIILTVSKFWNEAQSYAAFRQLTGYNAVVVDAEQLYYQFGYGIPKHPQAVKNFLRFALTYWNQKPEFLFIIGKSLYPTAVRTSPANYSANTVPAVGYPPADNLYGYNLKGTKLQDIAVGRLSATMPAQVSDYLQKVMEHESTGMLPYTKNILHFGGGGNVSETQILSSYLAGYENIIEDTLYGGNVSTFLKSSNVPFQTTLADSVRNSINRGVALMTFFGHASGTGFDVYVDDPASYQNQGKYPLVIANSCYSGDLFQAYETTSEKFVLQSNKAAWGFIATVSTGLPPFLNIYNRAFYQHVSYKSYGEPVGTCMKRSANDVYAQYPGNVFAMGTALEMGLHGDPACRINDLRKPDLAISDPSISYIPTSVTTDLDSFALQIVINNNGRTFNDSFSVEITRKYAKIGKPDDVYNILLSPIYYRDTVTVKMPTDRVNGVGLNTINVAVDPGNFIDELSNSNNNITKNLFITTGDILPVYPMEFAVIPNNRTWLKATTGDPFAPEKKYRIEIDTTDLFNSPFKKDTTIIQTGGVVKWRPSFLLSDSTVYFWRTGVDSANSGNYYHWKESSFQYINGKRGWGQDHFFQFKNDFYTYINYNRPQRKFEFVQNQKQLRIKTYGNTTSSASLADCLYDIDGTVMEYAVCGLTPSIHVFVIDPITLLPWQTTCVNGSAPIPTNAANDFCSCRNRAESYFIYRQNNNVSRDNLVNFLNAIPNGYYVGLYTVVNTQFQNFTPTQLQGLSDLGIDSAQVLAANARNRPWAFFTRKGYPNTKKEVVGQMANDMITLDAILENDWIFGNVTSSLVGPASEWKSFHWDAKSLDSPSTDSVSVDIVGITATGQETVFYTGIQLSTPEIFNLNNTIPAAQFPYLKLRMFTRDDANQTPSQLNRWHVLFEGVPEAAINPSAAFSFIDDTLQQGKTLSVVTAIENIGDYPMDSLWMRYFIINSSNQITSYFQKADSLRLNTFITDTFSVSNSNYPGTNSLWIEANPLNHPGHQKEQYHFNNLAEKSFYTAGDNINPLLEVMFDGIRIMDGEIVSAKPLIDIKLKDENPILLLTDTTSFDMYLQAPNEGNPKRITLGGNEITFIPATATENAAKIEYKPDFSFKDGKYKMMIRARDASNNSSGKGTGDYDYMISFEVINRQTITEVLNYPNPFSTSTRFVFTLTGSEVPDFMKIQIFTIDGRIVREIFQNELGPIRIGKNITEFAWDGTDEFGDKLASGVYLYRVFTKDNGETVEKSSTSADKYFKKGFGKMYLMR